MNGERQRRALAAVYSDDSTIGAWLVAETPLEVLSAVRTGLANCDRFIELTLANPDADDEEVRWNGRPVYVRPDLVTAIGPPLDTESGDDDD